MCSFDCVIKSCSASYLSHYQQLCGTKIEQRSKAVPCCVISTEPTARSRSFLFGPQPPHHEYLLQSVCLYIHFKLHCGDIIFFIKMYFICIQQNEREREHKTTHTHTPTHTHRAFSIWMSRIQIIDLFSSVISLSVSDHIWEDICSVAGQSNIQHFKRKSLVLLDKTEGEYLQTSLLWRVMKRHSAPIKLSNLPRFLHSDEFQSTFIQSIFHSSFVSRGRRFTLNLFSTDTSRSTLIFAVVVVVVLCFERPSRPLLACY